MRRFFFDREQRNGETVCLGADESHHVRRVLRLGLGDQVELCDGAGDVYLAEILNDTGTLLLRLGVKISEETADVSFSLTVCQGLIKPKNMELIARKCTELGVGRLQPFIGACSQGNLVRQFAGKRERFTRIINEACKQCRRTSPMALGDIISFEDVLQQTVAAGAFPLLFYEKAGTANLLSSFAEEICTHSSVALFFGPEGGFTEEEIAVAERYGCRVAGLGRFILRAETAVFAASAIVQHLRGVM